MNNIHSIRRTVYNCIFYNLYKRVSKKYYPYLLRIQYLLLKKQFLNLKNPKTLDEKIQWLKLYDDSPLRTQLTDKYAVRDWIKEQIGEKYLIPLLGKWDKPEDIEYSKLPEQFVLKANHGCGCNIIVKDKKALDVDEACRKMHKWLRINYAYLCGELQYEKIKPCIIAEEFISDLDGDIPDYKVWCFNGKAYYIMYLSDRTRGLKMAFFDRNWIKQDFVYSYPQIIEQVPRPNCLQEMLDIAEKLSSGFPLVRVDLYILKDGSIKFGELTFTSAGGKSVWSPSNADLELGNLLKLPII